MEQATWMEIPDKATIVFVPLGSVEQHGPHLPLSTDAVIAQRLATAAADEVARATGRPVAVAPTVNYGASGEHQAFPGTISIGHEALGHMLIELVRSISCWASRVIFVNGHGGNVETVKHVVSEMKQEGHDVQVVFCAFEQAQDAHAGHDETSVMLHLYARNVRTGDIVVGNTAPLSELMPTLVSQGVRAVSPNGVLGDPTSATPEAGSRAFSEVSKRIAAEILRDS